MASIFDGNELVGRFKEGNKALCIAVPDNAITGAMKDGDRGGYLLHVLPGGYFKAYDSFYRIYGKVNACNGGETIIGCFQQEVFTIADGCQLGGNARAQRLPV